MMFQGTAPTLMIQLLDRYALTGKTRKHAGLMLMEAACGIVTTFRTRGHVWAATKGRDGSLTVAVEAHPEGDHSAAKAVAVASLAMRGRAQGVTHVGR